MGPLRCLSSLRRAGVPLVRRLSCGHSRRLTTKGGEGGAKTLHLVRHAESNWNVLTAGGELFSATFVASIRDAIAMLPDQRAVPITEHVGAHPNILDADSRLSPAGADQSQALRRRAAASEIADDPPLELVLTSPLRSVFTACLSCVGWAVDALNGTRRSRAIVTAIMLAEGCRSATAARLAEVPTRFRSLDLSESLPLQF